MILKDFRSSFAGFENRKRKIEIPEKSEKDQFKVLCLPKDINKF